MMAKLEPIKMRQEFVLTSTMKFEDLRVYEQVLRGSMPVTLQLVVNHPVPPYTGRVPRFALWGAHGRTIQLQSAEDRAWRRRVRRNQPHIKITIPKVDFGG